MTASPKPKGMSANVSQGRLPLFSATTLPGLDIMPAKLSSLDDLPSHSNSVNMTPLPISVPYSLINGSTKATSPIIAHAVTTDATATASCSSVRLVPSVVPSSVSPSACSTNGLGACLNEFAFTHSFSQQQHEIFSGSSNSVVLNKNGVKSAFSLVPTKIRAPAPNNAGIFTSGFRDLGSKIIGLPHKLATTTTAPVSELPVVEPLSMTTEEHGFTEGSSNSEPPCTSEQLLTNLDNLPHFPSLDTQVNNSNNVHDTNEVRKPSRRRADPKRSRKRKPPPEGDGPLELSTDNCGLDHSTITSTSLQLPAGSCSLMFLHLGTLQCVRSIPLTTTAPIAFLPVQDCDSAPRSPELGAATSDLNTHSLATHLTAEVVSPASADADALPPPTAENNATEATPPVVISRASLPKSRKRPRLPGHKRDRSKPQIRRLVGSTSGLIIDDKALASCIVGQTAEDFLATVKGIRRLELPTATSSLSDTQQAAQKIQKLSRKEQRRLAKLNRMGKLKADVPRKRGRPLKYSKYEKNRYRKQKKAPLGLQSHNSQAFSAAQTMAATNIERAVSPAVEYVISVDVEEYDRSFESSDSDHTPLSRLAQQQKVIPRTSSPLPSVRKLPLAPELDRSGDEADDVPDKPPSDFSVMARFDLHKRTVRELKNVLPIVGPDFLVKLPAGKCLIMGGKPMGEQSLSSAQAHCLSFSSPVAPDTPWWQIVQNRYNRGQAQYYAKLADDKQKRASLRSRSLVAENSTNMATGATLPAVAGAPTAIALTKQGANKTKWEYVWSEPHSEILDLPENTQGWQPRPASNVDVFSHQLSALLPSKNVPSYESRPRYLGKGCSSNDARFLKLDAVADAGGVQRKSCLEYGLCEEICCRECLASRPNVDPQKTLVDWDALSFCCRFVDFRKLGRLDEAREPLIVWTGFQKSADCIDFRAWQAHGDVRKPPDVETAAYVLQMVSGAFLRILNIERLTMKFAQSLPINQVVWKHMCGVRDLCDVCATCIFNFHFCCPRCGFDACVMCVRERLNEKERCVDPKPTKRGGKRRNEEPSPAAKRDKFGWLFCNDGGPHELTNIRFAQTIPDHGSKPLTTLSRLETLLKRAMERHKIPMKCGCTKDSRHGSVTSSIFDPAPSLSPACSLADDEVVAPCLEDENSRDAGLASCGLSSAGIESSSGEEEEEMAVRPLSPMLRTCYCRSVSLDVPCSYLAYGEMLWLQDPRHPGNLAAFQQHWRSYRPVVVQNVHKALNPALWAPEVLAAKFAGQVPDGNIMDCRSGTIVEDVCIDAFWKGFANSQTRIRGLDGKKLLLKLKDWPPGDKFSEAYPEQYEDFRAALPIEEYTCPDPLFANEENKSHAGKLNMASYLPDMYLKPDLGPKMYTAYEMTFDETKATTNLHLDVSDAVNVLVHVCTPGGVNQDYFYNDMMKIIRGSGVSVDIIQRAEENMSEVGALWTIYHPGDAFALRKFLREVSAERGRPMQDYEDPIHDQLMYLDASLRVRLEEEHDIRGYTMVQMLGDAIFIPAGAAHQVQNLQCCIKVAEDFVSPEGVGNCASLIAEFRNLSVNHTNHEDKLQFQHILLHAVKSVVSVL